MESLQRNIIDLVERESSAKRELAQLSSNMKSIEQEKAVLKSLLDMEVKTSKEQMQRLKESTALNTRFGAPCDGMTSFTRLTWLLGPFLRLAAQLSFVMTRLDNGGIDSPLPSLVEGYYVYPCTSLHSMSE